MWLEAAALPSNPVARTDAELTRLDARVAEVTIAAEKGDRGAVAAALQSYAEISDEALAGAGGDPNQIDRLRAALDHQLAVLTAVADKVPDQAQTAIESNIERAIQRNQATIDRINAGGPSNGGTPGAKPDKPTKDTATPKPNPADRATPKPMPSQAGGGGGNPDPKPKPDHTPRGHGAQPTP
jgi:hypothetical protein